MTPGNPLTRQTATTATPPARRPVARRSGRRLAAGLVAGAAALAFVAAAIIPAGLALLPAYADTNETVTVYGLVDDDAQAYLAASDAEVTGPDRAGLSYEVYVTPTPTPEPEPVATTETSSSSTSSAAAARPYYSGGGSASEWMAAAGIAESDWGYVDYIVSRESGWNPNATNSSSGACGLVQALPCSKVPGNGYDPVDNLRWGTGYATSRYGGWAGAYAFWTSNHWW